MMTHNEKTPQAAGFDDWVDMWEKAQSDGTFKDAPKPPAQTGGSFFGLQTSAPNGDLPPSDADTEYWNQVYQRSNHAGDAPDIAHEGESVLQEQKKPVEKKAEKKKHKPLPETKPLRENKEDTSAAELGNIAKAQLRSPNPIYYYSAGKDQELHVTPNWSDGPKLNALIDLKLKLHALEGKINTMIGTGTPESQTRKLDTEIRQLRNQLDELSDSLHGGWAGEPKD